MTGFSVQKEETYPASGLCQAPKPPKILPLQIQKTTHEKTNPTHFIGSFAKNMPLKTEADLHAEYDENSYPYEYSGEPFRVVPRRLFLARGHLLERVS